MNVRAWLASAVWACLCGIASELFLVVALIGLLVLFFGALLSAMLAPLLLLLPSDLQWTGWQWIGIGFAIWLAVVALLGAVAWWAFVRCRAVVFAAPASRGARGSAIVVGVLASFAFLLFVSGLAPPLLPQVTPSPVDPTGGAPITV